MTTNNRATRIINLLKRQLNPASIEVFDESDRHAGHAGAQPEGETHYRLIIVSDAFEGLPPVQRQRKIYKILDEEFEMGLHALSIKAQTPKEVS